MTYRKKVVGIIFNPKGEILIGKYNGKKGSKGFGYNSKVNRTLPGGGKESGEHFNEALFREIYEEVGIPADKLHFVYKYKRFYFYKYKSKQKSRLQEKRGWDYKGKKQRIFVLYFNGENSDIHTDVTNEFIKTKRIPINKFPNYLHHRFIKFIDVKTLQHIIQKYLTEQKIPENINI